MSSTGYQCEINCQTGELLFDSSPVVLRPKTFDLLVFLASKPNHVFSKPEILAAVWKDSVVEEQAIFQSINEIRKEIGNAEVIKTFPRRGYCWSITNTNIIENGNTNKRTKQASLLALKNINKLFGVFAVLSLIVIAAWTYIQVSASQTALKSETVNSAVKSTEAHKGILVLPFNVSPLTSSQQWLRFGAMEGLIKAIEPNKSVTVFHLEDAIEILNRLPRKERSNVNKIFDKSGASHILETSISGVPGELNVIYTMYSRNSRQTNTFNATNIDSVLTKLVERFEQTLNKKLAMPVDNVSAQLQNDLIAKAMQFLEADDTSSALTFIESAVINDSSNVLAWYLLAKINLELNNVQSSISAANQALALKTNNLNEYKNRLLYFRGLGLLSSGQFPQAEHDLLHAARLSKTNKDWLYYAYTQSILGKLKQRQGHKEDAANRLASALEYQELLNCPMGIAQGHLDFAEFHLKNNELALAQQRFDIAKKLVEQKELNQVIPLLTHIKTLFETQQ